MVGKGGGTIETGKALNYRDQSDRQMCRLFLSMMGKTGLKLDKFGDATQPLAEV